MICDNCKYIIQLEKSYFCDKKDEEFLYYDGFCSDYKEDGDVE